MHKCTFTTSAPFPERCDSRPSPGLCEQHKQHQEPSSPPGARLQTAATPGCVADSAAQAETSRILSVTENVSCSETLPMPSARLSLGNATAAARRQYFFNSQVISGFTEAFCTAGWLVELQGFGLLNKHLILPPPAG